MKRAVRSLSLSTNNWRSRWLVNGQWKLLHRIARMRWDDGEEKISGTGMTVCGHEGRYGMPGIFSRMSLKRCPRCCGALKLPQGKGAPFNDKKLSKADQDK